jgi:UDP-N-acetylmuramate dehydrogenase
MTAEPFITGALIARLPEVRGRYAENAALKKITWLRVGGPAEVMFRPADSDDLASFLGRKPAGVPVIVIGVGSNILVRDGGVPGVVVRLGGAFADIKSEGDEILAGAAALDLNVAARARDAGLGGLEFLSGIPGTIGGALRMNAGAFGAEIKDVLISARALDGTGKLHHLAVGDMGYAYRRSAVPEDWTFVSARLSGRRGEGGEIDRRMNEIRSSRQITQPVRIATGGSTFTNPPGMRAWQLIDRAGCRGLKVGGAMVSEKHCNFLINTGNATAADLENLGEEIRRRVRDDAGVELHWEIRRIGIPPVEGDIS